MRSLLTDLERPAIGALLSAVDAALNSNTLLLKVRADAPLGERNREATLGAFLADALFLDMMLAADRARGWYNLQEYVPETGEYAVSGAGSLVREDLALTLDPIDEAGFAGRLMWMLCDSFSPYLRHLDQAVAESLVEGFFGEVFGPGSWPVTGDGARAHWSRAGWSFVSVRPDFLHSTGYYTGERSADLAYFDGGESDTATLFHRGDLFYLLLTNGSP